MNLKNFSKVFALFAVVLVIACVLLINSINTERSKQAIQQAVLSSTGYELTVAGDISVDLFPSLSLTLNDIRFRNPTHNQELASTSAAVLLVDVRALLGGDLYIRELSADGGVFLDILLSRVYSDVPQSLHPIARYSLLAHLLKLEKDGLVASPDALRWQAVTGDWLP